jgi:hypothetical protein
MNIRTITILSSALMVFTAVNANAGDFDFVDPCLKAQHAFDAQEREAMTHLDAAIAIANQVTVVPAEVASKWWSEVRVRMHDNFDQHIAPVLRSRGVEPTESHFTYWFDSEIEHGGGKKKLDGILLAQYKASFLKALNSKKAQWASERSDLDHKCPMDAGNQAIRIAVTAATSPITIISNNLEGAKHEPGVIDQVVHATTGISIPDMIQHGVWGGDGSVANDVGRFFSHAFGW